tara:strand:+ start:169 stop:447 length:279 start_codon:yes stop_codon:yes gene_type:complete
VHTSRDGKRALETRLSDEHVAWLIKSTVFDADIWSELPEKECLALFSGHSLRVGLDSSAEPPCPTLKDDSNRCCRALDTKKFALSRNSAGEV